MTVNIYRVLNLPSSEIFLFTFSYIILRSALWVIYVFYSHFINEDKDVQGASLSCRYGKDYHKLRVLERHRVTTSQFWKSERSLGCSQDVGRAVPSGGSRANPFPCLFQLQRLPALLCSWSLPPSSQPASPWLWLLFSWSHLFLAHLCLPLPSFKDSGIPHWAHTENPGKLPYFKILYLITRAMSSNIFTGHSK